MSTLFLNGNNIDCENCLLLHNNKKNEKESEEL